MLTLIHAILTLIHAILTPFSRRPNWNNEATTPAGTRALLKELSPPQGPRFGLEFLRGQQRAEEALHRLRTLEGATLGAGNSGAMDGTFGVPATPLLGSLSPTNPCSTGPLSHGDLQRDVGERTGGGPVEGHFPGYRREQAESLMDKLAAQGVL